MTIGEKIKFARTLAGVTQKELSFLSGIQKDKLNNTKLVTELQKQIRFPLLLLL